MDIRHKRGDTFVAIGTYRDDEGNLVDLSTAGISITSAVKANNGAVFPLTVTFLAELGKFQVKGQTSTWPLGKVKWDIQYTQGDIVTSSETVEILIQEDATP
jgi:hypothetical protein